jgi:Ribonuclease G/E
VIRVAVDRGPGQIRAAAVGSDGRLLDLALERPGGPTDVGDLHRGRVTARVPALAGAFVALAGVDGFLPDSAGGRACGEGAILAVRVTRAPQGGQGPRLEAVDHPVDSGPPALLARGPGAVARLLALHDGATPREGWDDHVAEQVEALADPSAALPGGGRMSVHPTPALTAIDVDLAGGAAERAAKTRAHQDANTKFLPALARQIRLRNLSGAIVVDLAGLSVRRRAALGEAFAAALADDPLHPRFLGFSALGLAEILRPRGHAPLHELLAGPHAAALAAARALALEAAATPSRRLVLRAAPAVAEALRLDPVLQTDMRDRLGEALRIRPDPALPDPRWLLETA